MMARFFRWISTEVGVALPQGLDDDGDDDFSVDIESAPDEPSYQPLTNLLRSAEAGDEAIDRLIEICRGVVEEERGKRQGGAALKAVGVANARLAEVDLGNADPKTHNGIARQLDEIIKRADELKLKVNELMEAEKNKAASKAAAEPS